MDTATAAFRGIGLRTCALGYASGTDRLTEAAALLTLLRDARSWAGLVQPYSNGT
jgi:hypothetical protein